MLRGGHEVESTMKIVKKVATALTAAVLCLGLLGSAPAAADSSWGKGVAIP